MATAVVSIICIALIVLGGMTMSQGFLTSADTTAFSAEMISAREGEIMRTDVDTVRAAYLSWGDLLRVTVANSGQTKLANFNKWDAIVNYYDGAGVYHTEWLPYTEGELEDNQWQKARIGLNGPTEYFEPGILNPGEELVILARLNPPPADGTTVAVAIATPNGIDDATSFANPGGTRLTPHSESKTLATTRYYELAEDAPADGAAMTETTEIFEAGEVNRKVLFNENDPSRLARHVFPLTGISEIPASTWTVYYHCRTLEFGGINPHDVDLNIDILVRRADGTIRTTIDSGVAKAYIDYLEVDTWVSENATYNFPGYAVVDEGDHLEIVFYGETEASGPDNPGYMQIRIDDDTLDEADQTRIET